MERALAVVDPTDAAKDLVREAGTLAAGVDADLVLIHVTTDQEYSARREAMEAIPNGATNYTPGEAEQGATQFASDLGDKADRTLAAAEAYDCDHVFLAGRKRSPAGKAIFGDATQKVILESDGPVTVVTA